MFGYLIRRIISGILVLLMATVATFALFFYGPSDPASAMCPRQPCSEERLDAIRANLGLDQGGPSAFADYMKGIFVGSDLGTEGVEIESAEWRGGRWLLTTTSGHQHVADAVIAATGFLHRKKMPRIDGMVQNVQFWLHPSEMRRYA